jgi:hypothetical protein
MTVAFLSGCALWPLSDSKQETVLFNPVIENQALTVSVMSYGCTKAEDFYLRVNGDRVELRRTSQDTCRKAPELMRLSFSYPFEARAYRFENDVRFSDRVGRR